MEEPDNRSLDNRGCIVHVSTEGMIQVVGYTMLRVCDGWKDVLDIDQDGTSVSTAQNGARLISC